VRQSEGDRAHGDTVALHGDHQQHLDQPDHGDLLDLPRAGRALLRADQGVGVHQVGTGGQDTHCQLQEHGIE